ncbi:MAG: hypothetical protein NTY64_15640 [Deltaproteobacteria bacterium]|nr:hypothetical protein [Deltaproteobacteria bacterium]
MINFADMAFISKLTDALNMDQTFAMQAKWFDGSILLESAGSQCWLKVYRQMLLDGTRCFRDLTLPGKRHFEDDPSLSKLGVMTRDIVIEGNMMEANRIIGAIYALSNCITKVSK